MKIITRELYIDSKRARQIPEEAVSKVTQLNPLKTGFRCCVAVRHWRRQDAGGRLYIVGPFKQLRKDRRVGASVPLVAQVPPSLLGDSHSPAVLSLYATSYRLLIGHPLLPSTCTSSELDPRSDGNSTRTVF